LREKLHPALFGQFGKAAEKFIGTGHLPLFDGGETDAPQNGAKPVETEAMQYTRRGTIDEKIPRKAGM
jgi:hypothetical protein